MKMQTDKSKRNNLVTTRQESRAVTNSVAQNKSTVKQGIAFMDNRPEAITQRKMLDKVSNRPQVNQLKLKQGLDGDITDGGVSHTEVNSVLPATFTRDEVKQVEGKSMEAKTLGPGATGGGSATNNHTRPMARELSHRMGRRYVAGHLLNHHLGGSGVDRTNITAFSSKSNSQHLHYTEKHIKNAVKAGNWVYYKLDTTRNNATNIAETITTTWGLLDEDLAVEGGLHKATFDLDPGNPTAEHTEGAMNLFSSVNSQVWGKKYSEHVIKRLGLTGKKVFDAYAIMQTGDYDDDGNLLNEDDIREQLEDRDIGDYSVNGIISLLKPELIA
ncbi:MAG: hypothetical protein GQ564_22625 [Bacteroidales bacterium]|nr:hypothetical protein [Bacteroidales bacterium]